MLPANVGAGRSDAASARIDHLDDLRLIERTAYSDAPLFPERVAATCLDVSPGIDVEVPDPRASDDLSGIADRPALDDAGRIERSVQWADVEEAVRLQSGLLRQRQDFAHFIAAGGLSEISAVDRRDLAVRLVCAEAPIDAVEISEHSVDHTAVNFSGDFDRHGHAHQNPRRAHGSTAPPAAAPIRSNG